VTTFPRAAQPGGALVRTQMVLSRCQGIVGQVMTVGPSFDGHRDEGLRRAKA
jgi:hypothetical protein